MENQSFNIEELKGLLIDTGLANPNGNAYKERLHKYQQISDYIVQLEAIIKKLSSKRTVTILDCGCGKSYLSFVANHYLTNVLKRKVHFICIDSNKELIEKCREAAKKLEFENMEFNCSEIINFVPSKEIDIVYSLHACDIATDQMIAKGIKVKAKYILSVSCCQHTVRKQLKKHPLTSISTHNHYKERLVDMISDSMRGLLLESLGYTVNIFEFVASKYTPKNVMVRARKNGDINNRAYKSFNEYEQLYKTFNINPMLRKYINEELIQALELKKEA
ncbi:class I SAM-dependent methyltransferase [Clostridium estertheticum]|uniref:class I SAM-dependent methyltransferase n=1 Tax=Clostridium estertheticum TaxID=238834 RepID=UPI001CF4DD0E|nr:SAM-dependent methyltransferase [Clostridium estertheticum]MCB2357252.1 SAM-dependent methyltransferase [Clostridium estertheticum]WAG43916.1 SAM-dependent methyltransferase [Clostridium estertheticum]